MGGPEGFPPSFVVYRLTGFRRADYGPGLRRHRQITMIGTIRKHSNWLWGVIVVAVILSFVIWTDSRPGRTIFSQGSSDFGRLYGQPVTRDQYLKARMAAEVDNLMRGGQARSGVDTERQVQEYLLLQAKIRELGIEVSDESVGTYLRETFKDPATGAFNYDALIQNLQQRVRLTEDAFIGHVRQQVAIQHLIEVVSASSRLVTPREAEAEYRRENEQYVTTAALFSASNLLAGITAKPEELTQFYSNRVANYRIPERTLLNYVRFDASNHVAAAEAELAKDATFTNRLEQYYTQRGADAFRDEQDKVLSKEVALRKLKEETVEQGAMTLARRAAVAFNEELSKLPSVTPSTFASAAQKAGLAVRSTQPFRAGERIFGLEAVSKLAQRVPTLDAETPYTEPLDGDTFVVIPILQGRLPAEIPTFETVRERVTRDFKLDRARAAAREAGEKFQQAASAAVAAGKSFSEVAANQHVTHSELPPFAINSQALPGLDARLNLYSIKNAAFVLKPNEVGRYTESGDGGFVLYLKEKRPVADAVVKAGLPATLAETRQQRRMAAFQSWFGAEFQKSGLAVARAGTAAAAAP